jgi:hypothetical protein
MRKVIVIVIIGLVSLICSCGTSSQHCDAYSDVEIETVSDKV